MEPETAPAPKASSLDIVVTQAANGIYTVTGKDAASLYARLLATPEEQRTLRLGDVRDDGSFTLEKLAGAEQMTIAKAG